MSKRVVLHLLGEDPILAEMAALPGASDQFITVRNPRKRDGKPLPYITDGATSFLFPLARITFIEIMDDEEQGSAGIISFFRDEPMPRRR